ncbi:trimeric intracellular cation channel family protein [Falsiroseomonas sp.]|uniref:trimeric intracellular cation channel family protein n=1 Tax=Falsiroseomonas sp. TaxID=2870721 RepID=UPI002717F41B|nr:trimeric intracellular cation channel family protein [Falsiroseomonas sp.]MDO9500727.1 trimeric intracellular cation channel family protein [Falsiroseomonas sp.]MDP3417046.1 trimeric intracellular cation channel family protein [Falsiroseomonas sp.]
MGGLDSALQVLDLLGIAVFAASGALVASRKQLDLVGFVLIGMITGFGGGTVRDLLLGRTPVFWLNQPEVPAIAAAAALLVFFFAHRVESRFKALLWADALGMALFAVLGAEIALIAGAQPWAAVLLGTVTATAGGIMRDVVCDELPLILRKEIYITAAAAAALAYVALRLALLPRDVALIAAIGLGFGIRGAAIWRGWSLPAFKPRPARDYPDRR